MICPDPKNNDPYCKNCGCRVPHIQSESCVETHSTRGDCPACIPYVPEQETNCQEKTDSSYELTPDEICTAICGDSYSCGERGKPYPDCSAYDDAVEAINAYNKKLADMGTVYIGVKRNCEDCNGVGSYKVPENNGEDYSIEKIVVLVWGKDFILSTLHYLKH